MTVLYLHFCPGNITCLCTFRPSLSWEIHCFGIGHYLLVYFFLIYFILFIYLFTLQYCIGFAIHQHASAMGAAFFIVQFSHRYMTIGKTIALTRCTFVGKVMSLLLIFYFLIFIFTLFYFTILY